MNHATPCPMCGASLAPDQRFCLSCGTRVAPSRLDLPADAEAEAKHAEAAARNGSMPAAANGAVGAAGAVHAAAVPDTGAAAAPAPTLSRLDRIGGPMGAAAVVLVSLGVGFLAGQASSDPPPPQRAPVVTIESALPSGAVTPAGQPSATETTGGGDVDGAVAPPVAEQTAGGAAQTEATR